MVEQADYIKKQSAKKYTPKELYTILAPKCWSCQPGIYSIFNKVRIGGSDGRWSSYGTALKMQYVNNKLLFIFEHVDEGEDGSEWNYSHTVTKEYPNEITFAELVKVCRENNSPLEID